MNKAILKLSIPNIISNITVPLIGLVDLALMGHLDSDVYIGAISLGAIIFNFIYWGFGFLRMSTSGFTAQSYGADNQQECLHILLRGLLISTVISLVILLLQAPIEWGSFKILEGSAEVESLAAQYFRVRVWAAPATLGLYVVSGWFLGMQNAKLVMISSILANVFNLIFSYVFVYLLEMNSAGVALGTVIAQYLGFFISLYLLVRNYKHLFGLYQRKLLMNLKFMKDFFKVNTDIFIRTFCIIVVFTLFTSKSAGINDHILAVNTILLQFLMFFSFFIDGFAFAGEALAGKYMGMQNKGLFLQLTKRLFVWGAALAVVFTLVYLFGNKYIIRALTNDAAIYQTAKIYLPWVICIPLVSFASYVWDGIFIGVTASREMRNSMLASTVLLFAPCFIFLQPILGNHALWLGMTLFMFGRAVFQAILFPTVLRKTFA